VVYIPNQGIPHVNVTFAGFIGANTGMNAAGITLSEIGDSPKKDYPFNLNGEHFTSMFRKVLYDAHTLDEAVSIIQRSRRIKKYYFVVGSGDEKRAVKMKAHAPDLIIWNDNDPSDPSAPNVKPDLVYHAESRDPLAWGHIQEHYGSYDPGLMMDLIRAVPIKGANLLDVLYDTTSRELWVAYAEGQEEAYKRPFVHIRLDDYVGGSSMAGGKLTSIAIIAAPLLILAIGVAVVMLR